MIPCSQIESIKELKDKCSLIEKSHIRLTITQQQVLKKQDSIDNKLTWFFSTFVGSLIIIVLYYVFGING